MYKFNKIFQRFKLEEVIPLFDELKDLSGKDAIWEYRVKRKRNGNFDGLNIRHDKFSKFKERQKKGHSWGHNCKLSKDEIINELSSKSRMPKKDIVFKFSKEIEKKYEEAYSRYLPYLLDTHLYQKYIYMKFYDIYEGHSDLINFDENSPELFLNKEEIPNVFHSNLVSEGLVPSYSRFYNDKNIYYIYYQRHIEYYSKDRPGFKDEGKIRLHSGWVDRNIFFEDLVNNGKINVKIYDHLGNLHEFTEYHKIIYE
jgi:hypothetical protein